MTGVDTTPGTRGTLAKRAGRVKAHIWAIRPTLMAQHGRVGLADDRPGSQEARGQPLHHHSVVQRGEAARHAAALGSLADQPGGGGSASGVGSSPNHSTKYLKLMKTRESP